MIEKITIQNLIDVLTEKHSIEKKDAELFVKGVFDLVEESLATEKYVKIKGFGTFKLIEVDSRESINVNTGERIEIQGHTKISFTPENLLKELINKPFSHFETVILNENYKDTSLDIDNEGSPLNNVEDIIPDIATVSNLQEDKSEEVVTTLVEKTKEETIEDMVDISSSIIETVQEEPVGEKIEMVSDEMIVTEEVNENIVVGLNLKKKKSKKSRNLFFVIILLIILIISGLCWMFWRSESNIVNSKTVIETTMVDIQDTSMKIRNKKAIMDTTAIPIMEREKVATLADTIEYSIVGTKNIHILQKGETIIRVSLKYYGAKKFWPYIAKYNEKVIKDANNVSIGTKIFIPELSKK